jgi:peptide/nickel transport system ATP-binding protein
LDVRDLHVTYQSSAGPVPAVRGVDLHISAGETLGIAGESGSGKSTIAMSLLKLVAPGTTVTGSVLLDGQDVLTMRPGQLRAVRWTKASVVFQGAQHVLNPVRKVGRQIDEAIAVHQTGSANDEGRGNGNRVGDLLALVGLPRRRADDYPHELSGGQKQRVMIAMALACDPLLIVADEPTTALDVMVQAQVLRLLEEIKRERGLSMLFITHDLSVLSSIADRLAVMYAGRIVEEGPARALLRDSDHPYTRALSGAFPTIGDPDSRFAPRGLQGDPPDPSNLPAGCSFHPRCPVVTDRCDSVDVQLVAVSRDQGRRAACVHVGSSR